MTLSAFSDELANVRTKPKEYYWQVNRIEVLRPIQYISFKRNEVKCTVSDKPIFTDEERTQRQSVALKDVRYRIAASIIPSLISWEKRHSCTNRPSGGSELESVMCSLLWVLRSLLRILKSTIPPSIQTGPSKIPWTSDLWSMIFLTCTTALSRKRQASSCRCSMRSWTMA